MVDGDDDDDGDGNGDARQGRGRYDACMGTTTPMQSRGTTQLSKSPHTKVESPQKKRNTRLHASVHLQ